MYLSAWRSLIIPAVDKDDDVALDIHERDVPVGRKLVQRPLDVSPRPLALATMAAWLQEILQKRPWRF